MRREAPGGFCVDADVSHSGSERITQVAGMRTDSEGPGWKEARRVGRVGVGLAGSDGDRRHLAGRAEMKGRKGEPAARPVVRSALRLRGKVAGLVGRGVRRPRQG